MNINKDIKLIKMNINFDINNTVLFHMNYFKKHKIAVLRSWYTVKDYQIGDRVV